MNKDKLKTLHFSLYVPDMSMEWHIKQSSVFPTHFADMTYNVFSGTLNLTQSIAVASCINKMTNDFMPIDSTSY